MIFINAYKNDSDEILLRFYYNVRVYLILKPTQTTFYHNIFLYFETTDIYLCLHFVLNTESTKTLSQSTKRCVTTRERL